MISVGLQDESAQMSQLKLVSPYESAQMSQSVRVSSDKSAQMSHFNVFDIRFQRVCCEYGERARRERQYRSAGTAKCVRGVKLR